MSRHWDIWLLSVSTITLLVATIWAITQGDAFGAALGGFILAINMQRTGVEILRIRRRPKHPGTYTHP